MKHLLSERLSSIKPSPSSSANARVGQLRAQGHDIVNLTIGEPDFDTPEHIKQAAVAAMNAGDTHYTPTPGTVQLREAIVEKLQRDNGLTYGVDEIVVGCGGKHVVFHALAATLNPGDEVIIPAPYWVSYPDLVVLHGAQPVIVTGEPHNGLKISAEQLASSITPRTKWVILNSPNNPTGSVYSESELLALARVLEDYPQVLVMADEIYEHFVFGEARHTSIVKVAPQLKARTLIVNGASKGYAMTGWRIGFGAGPAELIQAIVKLLTQTTSCPSSVSQAAAVAAFTGDQAPVAAMSAAYAQRCKVIVEELTDIPGLGFDVPQGAFYVYADVSGAIGKITPQGQRVARDSDLVEHLAEVGGVATVTGAAFGLSPYLRISFAGDEQSIREGCRRIRRTLSALQENDGQQL
ncbi:pyridoxal phosphate-dependent aminotransferase [Pseudomonas sp. NPDC012596]|uniref:pyridoxal phosphate-dependent aminotransferase n=1 Tax=Pseudomonas sp. NPDC012596 TaxID=3364419 RepID=UPI00368552DE